MFLIVLLFAFAYGEFGFNYPLNIPQTTLTPAKPIIGGPFRVNAKSGSQLTIYHKYSVNVCFHRRPLQGISSLYWNISCNIITTYGTNVGLQPYNSVDTIFLRDAEYHVGIAFTDPTIPDSDTIVFSLGRSADDCPFGQAYDDSVFPGRCILPQNITTNASLPVTLGANDVTFFTFEVPQNGIGSVMAFSENAKNDLIFLFRLWGTPTNTHRDGEAGSTAYLAFPRPGTYHLRVRATNNVTDALVSIRFVVCHSTNMSGPECLTFYNQSNYDGEVPTRGGVYKYWILPIPKNSKASVSIRPDDGDLWNYELFASLGQLPQKGNAELSNCYGSGCQGARTINITTGDADENWYISVLPELNNKTFSIWFSSVCAPACPIHGLCITDGEFIGKCACSAEYSGAACQISNALSAQYIVLIIIACLLFSSACVGFIAQAYLKRKGYQNI